MAITLEPSEVLVVALGGNAMQSPSGDDRVEADFERTRHTAEVLVSLASARRRLVITHGNGPQVGNHLLRSELAHSMGRLPSLPLDVCVADTQGGMGYMLQQCLANAFHAAGLPGVVASCVTQVLVSADDRAFAEPSKPIGEMIAAEQVDELTERGWVLREDHHRGGFRRVVASPDPLEIVEGEAIRALVDQGVVVVAAGGGGIPVVDDGDGNLRGVPAVVDKDLAGALLAADLGADAFLILTDVPNAYVAYDSPGQRALHTVSLEEARAHLAAGEFSPGSMGPKIDALCRFVAATGRSGILTAIDDAAAALEGNAGTRVVPSA